MKRVLSVTLTLVLLLTLGTSCLYGAAAQSDAEENFELTFLTRCFNDSSAFYNVLWTRMQAWAQEHPSIKIIDDSVFDSEQFNNKFKICVAVGQMPNLVFSYGGPAFKPYVENGLILDLTPYIEADPSLQDWFSKFSEASLSTCRFSGIDGVYGIPLEMFATGVYYNKGIFEDNGLQPPTTISEFEQVCDALIEKGIQPMTIGDKSVYRGGHFMGELFAKRFGSDYFARLQDGSLNFTDPEIKELYSLLKGWQDKGYFGEGLTTIDQEMERTMFANGETAMMQMAMSYMPSIIKSTNEAGVFSSDNIGFISFPYFDEYPENKNVWHSGPSGVLSISSDSSQQQIAATLDLVANLSNIDCAESCIEANSSYIPCIQGVSYPEDSTNVAKEFRALYADMTGGTKEPGEALPGSFLSIYRNQIQAMFADVSIDEVIGITQDAAEEARLDG